ncbi:type III secretion system gatekeeper subunit SctW [Stenotrophomonas sp. PD6]|uniref:type III secretion system gatekeeper subunit SctW n=1 Tax=Stenotrophomonas sp. PD6 TaxID=3368612 RepID=UPI003B9EA0E6
MALSMQDEAAVLAAALGRQRSGQNAGGAKESQAWIDHVLDDKVHDKVIQVRQLLDGMRSPVQVLGLLKQLFPDPSDVLAVLRAFLADDELEALRELLEMSLEQLLEEQAAQGNTAALKGGLNVAIKARLAARKGGLSARQLRHSYRDLLGNPQDGIGEYAAWIDQYGFHNRALVLNFMEQAMGTDMFSLDPSGSRVEFGLLLSQVRNLTALRSVDELLVRETTRTGLLARMATTADAVVLGLLDVVRGLQDWSGLFSGPLANARVALAMHERARLVQALRRALAGLPDAIWIDPSARDVAVEGLEAIVVESMARERWHSGRASGVMA